MTCSCSMLLAALVAFDLFAQGLAGVGEVHAEISAATFGAKKRRPEDNIPVIEIRGEGKPMTSAQIRALEEASNGGPLDIKVEKTWRPIDCPHAAARLDFVTFHYKGYLEDGKKFDQTYGRGSIRIQLGTSMVMPGLDKGMRGMCATELRKIRVPYRLSRKNKSKVWKHIPNDEHWLTFNVEVLEVEPFSPALQFSFMDLNNDTFLTESELVKLADNLRHEFGKTWSNEDIDNVLAARYYVKYFDVDGDGQVSLPEYEAILRRDQEEMTAAEGSTATKKPEGRKRDPGLAWILDFNNDGIVTVEEADSADQVLAGGPKRLHTVEAKKDEL